MRRDLIAAGNSPFLIKGVGEANNARIKKSRAALERKRAARI